MANNSNLEKKQIPRKRDLRVIPKAGISKTRRRLKEGGQYE